MANLPFKISHMQTFDSAPDPKLHPFRQPDYFVTVDVLADQRYPATARVTQAQALPGTRRRNPQHHHQPSGSVNGGAGDRSGRPGHALTGPITPASAPRHARGQRDDYQHEDAPSREIHGLGATYRRKE